MWLNMWVPLFHFASFFSVLFLAFCIYVVVHVYVLIALYLASSHMYTCLFQFPNAEPHSRE
jgi:hypothetical protein